MRDLPTPSSSLEAFIREEHGAAFYEAVLLACLVAVVCVIALLALGKGT